MEKYTDRKLAIKEHRILWNELTKTGEEHKSDVIDRLYKKGKLSRLDYAWDCPLCEYFDSQQRIDINCYDVGCIVIWPKVKDSLGRPRPPCHCSYYNLWYNEGDPEKRKKIAKQIAELPERKE